MHDGCAARVWTQILVDQGVAGPIPLSAGTPLLTRVPGVPGRILANSQPHRDALAAGPEVFETLHAAALYAAHEMICFYTWGDGRCALPRGATRATLLGHLPDLRAGDVLVFEEVRGAITGDPADADPARRYAVRLTAVDATQRDNLTETDITAIRWHPEDALPGPLCLTADVPDVPGAPCGGAISVARGNIVLAAHGRLLPVEELGAVPASTLTYVAAGVRCEPGTPDAVPPRFRPRLREPHVAQRVPYDHGEALARPASWATRLSPSDALPAVELALDPSFAGEVWRPQRDLLGSPADEPAFVLEATPSSPATASARG
jgi:hypothetical protein